MVFENLGGCSSSTYSSVCSVLWSETVFSRRPRSSTFDLLFGVLEVCGGFVKRVGQNVEFAAQLCLIIQTGKHVENLHLEGKEAISGAHPQHKQFTYQPIEFKNRQFFFFHRPQCALRDRIIDDECENDVDLGDFLVVRDKVPGRQILTISKI
jgi:hypothetical protein